VIENGRVLQVMNPGEAARDTIASYGGPALFLWNRNNRIGFTTVPFDVSPSVAVGGGRIFVSPGRIPEVHELDASGRIVRIMRVDREPARITRERFDAFVEERVAAQDDAADAAEVRRQYGQTPMRERMPAYSRLLVDDEGNVWAERYREDTALPATWTLLNASGEAVGMVEVPSGVRLHAVAGSRAVGVMRDEMDVEHVVAWPLIPIDAPSSPVEGR
jgi:hypothetical protein